MTLPKRHLFYEEDSTEEVALLCGKPDPITNTEYAGAYVRWGPLKPKRQYCKNCVEIAPVWSLGTEYQTYSEECDSEDETEEARLFAEYRADNWGGA